MTEPAERAWTIDTIALQTMHWSVSDERIGGAQSDSYALYTRSGVIFVDPLPLTYVAADRFPWVGCVLLTRGCHQRASWRYRYEHGARVVAPRGSPGLRTEPDQHYVEGTRLPADFKAVHTPGPEYHHYALHRPGEPSILFAGDLVTRRDSSGRLELGRDSPDLPSGTTRNSVEKVLELDFELLCLSHGGYVDEDPRGALRELLEQTP